MSGAVVAAPPGYTRTQVGDATIIARDDAVDGVCNAFAGVRTLHCWAATVPGARAYRGRATAWGARLPGTSLDVVVRHSRHGGLLAPITGDRFRWPSRAPWELEASQRLLAAGVPTPTLVAYALYPAELGFCRADVATARLPEGQDFPALWSGADADLRERAMAATAALVRLLSRGGALHEDLNVKNVYLAQTSGGLTAYALDVDRVRFDVSDAAARNLARLTRSMRKAREQFGLALDDATIDGFARLARDAAAPLPASPGSAP